MNGAGSSVLGTTSTLAGGGTATTFAGTTLATTTAATAATATTAAITTYTTAGMMANAALTTLATQASISLINNKGDINATLKELGSEQSLKGVVASVITAGVAGANMGNYGVDRIAIDAATGCATGEITGSSCKKGAETAAAFSALAWVGDAARKNQIEDSKKFPGLVDKDGNVINNISGQSSGIDNNGLKIGGERFSVEGICKTLPEMCANEKVLDKFINLNGEYILPTDFIKDTFESLYIDKNGISSLGGLQGGQGTLFGKPYNPGSFTDKVIESFGGKHDFLNSFPYYDSIGNNLPNSAAGPSFLNWINVPLSFPVGFATLNNQIPGLYSGLKVGQEINKKHNDHGGE